VGLLTSGNPGPTPCRTAFPYTAGIGAPARQTFKHRRNASRRPRYRGVMGEITHEKPQRGFEGKSRGKGPGRDRTPILEAGRRRAPFLERRCRPLAYIDRPSVRAGFLFQQSERLG
jgi:hypothetical protein